MELWDGVFLAAERGTLEFQLLEAAKAGDLELVKVS